MWCLFGQPCEQARAHTLLPQSGSLKFAFRKCPHGYMAYKLRPVIHRTPGPMSSNTGPCFMCLCGLSFIEG